MASRWGALAQRQEAEEPPATSPPSGVTVERHISWGELGCPQDIGHYPFEDMTTRVMRVHVVAAEGDPAALFTLRTRHPPYGPPEHMLGHRVA